MAEDVKAVLYAWCGRKKLGVPHYDTQSMQGGRGRLRFRCEVRVQNHDYVGMGNSTSKKDAASNAARDFCHYLVREGLIAAAEVPQFNVSVCVHHLCNGCMMNLQQDSIEGNASEEGWGGKPPEGPKCDESAGWDGDGGDDGGQEQWNAPNSASEQAFGSPWQQQQPPPSAHQAYVDQLSAKRAEEVTQVRERECIFQLDHSLILLTDFSLNRSIFERISTVDGRWTIANSA